MKIYSSAQKRAFTLIELLVVVAIIGIFAAITMPAVQYAREAARKTACMNNLRQFGIAFSSYTATTGGLPPSYSTDPQRGWALELLPHLDAETFLNDWKWEDDYFSAQNRRLCMKYMAIFHCPSVPDGRRLVEVERDVEGVSLGFSMKGSPSDYYAHIGGVQMYGNATFKNPLEEGEITPLSSLEDGATHTILLNEQGGRPQYWSERKKVAGQTIADDYRCLWAGAPVTVLPNLVGKKRVINENNASFYSFHPNTSNAVFADGGVRSISERAIPYIVLALNTRNGGENVRREDLDLAKFDESFVDATTGLYPDGSSP
ncbi:MAG: DUF1559 domain-containing protein [Planctomycetia bacterium]|nr:DUF1559 domain-containing protein [Planctomycetia bacterium]